MSGLKDKIDLRTLPRHVAIIMDGNGRWAKSKGSQRVFGHRHALKAVRDVLEGSVELGLEHITLFTFSTENWKRPKAEVIALMQLLIATIKDETKTLLENNIRLEAIGDLDALPSRAQRQLEKTREATRKNTGTVLTLALSYGGRWDILNAVRKIAEDVKAGRLSPDDISEVKFRSALSTHFLPDPELMIRTSGEFRISNFLLWELAYTELYITSKLWPDFRREDLFAAIVDYQNRERRFGKISEQLNPQTS
jgi:undecaprenyl diphosphate synthase